MERVEEEPGHGREHRGPMELRSLDGRISSAMIAPSVENRVHGEACIELNQMRGVRNQRSILARVSAMPR